MNGVAVTAARQAARRGLFERFARIYPQLPTEAVLNAIADAERTLWLCGYTDAPGEIVERLCRHHVDAAAAALGILRHSVAH